ncbi:helix-turn-helix domain-containing protein [Enterococcus cecorum]|uniref:helix-turn-helix domain-containing protein n=1 Tax=Enterococcus cecorum TaxID=44008 RepID=UPI00148DF153|nr:helix-turn-helix domain-containing protein [Enterococcus cecorum]
MNRIRELRKNRGLTLKEVAKAVMIAPSQLSFYETGKRQPRELQTWENLANYFGVSVAYITGISDYPIDEKQIEKLVYSTINDLLSSDCEILLKKAIQYFTNKEFDFAKITSDFYSSNVYNRIIKSDVNLINTYFAIWFEDYLIESYQKEMKTNENLIFHVLNSIPDDVYEYNHLDDKKDYLLSDIVKNSADKLKKISVITYSYDKSIDENLINQIIDILDEAKQKILALNEKYPDSPSDIARRIILFGKHQNPFDGKVMTTFIDDSKIVKDELHLPTEIYQSVIEYFNDDNHRTQY